MNWFKENAIYRYDDDEYVIMYSPIARKYAVASEEHIADFLKNGGNADVFRPLAEYVPLDRQNKVRAPRDYTLLTVLPNNVCNFNCSYCYSAAGRNQSVLDVEKLRRAVDFFIDSKPEGFSKPLTISFMGGGEPMLSWNVVRQGIEYAQGRAASKGLKLNLRVITNGSILNEGIIDFLKSENVEVSVSFEILEDIQNQQRKHYNLVKDNIRRLIASGIPVQINSTITPSNVMRMEEMMDVLISEFPQVSNAMFEPVTAQGLFPSPDHMRKFYQAYIDGFIAVREKGDRAGVQITSFAYLRTIFPLERACPGEFCITADGFITGCYCVATDSEPLIAHTKYGEASETDVKFDMERYENLLSANVYSKGICRDCEVKWNCGGGCFHQFHSYTQEYCDEVCRFTKDFVSALVRYKVRKQIGTQIPPLPVLLTEQF